MYTNYSTPYKLLLLVAVILFISLIENILRFEFFSLENQQQSDFIMIEQVFDISKLVLHRRMQRTRHVNFHFLP